MVPDQRELISEHDDLLGDWAFCRLYARLSRKGKPTRPGPRHPGTWSQQHGRCDTHRRPSASSRAPLIQMGTHEDAMQVVDADHTVRTVNAVFYYRKIVMIRVGRRTARGIRVQFAASTVNVPALRVVAWSGFLVNIRATRSFFLRRTRASLESTSGFEGAWAPRSGRWSQRHTLTRWASTSCREEESGRSTGTR